MDKVVITPADVNDADVRNARRLLARHRPDEDGRCQHCGVRFPCIPCRIARTTLATAMTRA